MDQKTDEFVYAAEWAAEIAKRSAELDSGEVETIPWEEVRKELFPARKRIV
jgi:putative addiction module component (TIGR02574 family)